MAAGIPTRSTSEPLASINVTPLVDVMLVLLAIFMITARLEDDHAMPIDLPKAASGESAQRMLNIAIDREGVRTVDGAAAPDDDTLRALALEVFAKNPEVRTIIQASTRAEHGAVMRVLDTLRLAGIHKIAFAVEPDR
ncbi:MAG TPA: biopolymer transporter ExbD [Polyangiales bacterium]|nr:biopolymer transporter ExbD [Polyangiales bacterium]